MEKMPWYKSNTLRGLLVAAITLIAQKAGIADAVGDADAAKLVDLGLGLVESLALAYAAYARVTQPTPPVSETAIARTEALQTGEKK
jgi:predicted metal-dependent HD superfamily phosphohydrolase